MRLKFAWCKPHGFKSHTIHRLISLTFLGNSELSVNHIDGNKLNNSIKNLEYCTMSDNIKHAFKTGLKKPTYGELNGQCKLSKNDVLFVKELYKSGYYTQKELSDVFNVSQSNISKILNNVSL